MTICKDQIRDSPFLSHYEMNLDVSSKEFISALQLSNWSIDKICLDYFRMRNTYLNTRFKRQFFLNLKELANNKILTDTRSGPHQGQIYLPFCPHMFYYIHVTQMDEEFEIKYLFENDISLENNCLHVASVSQEYNMLSTMYCSLFVSNANISSFPGTP